MPLPPPETVKLYCECGAMLAMWGATGECYGETAAAWMKHHQGPGHGPTDRKPRPQAGSYDIRNDPTLPV